MLYESMKFMLPTCLPLCRKKKLDRAILQMCWVNLKEIFPTIPTLPSIPLIMDSGSSNTNPNTEKKQGCFWKTNVTYLLCK